MDCEGKFPNVGVPWLTRSWVDLDRAVYAPIADCEAVIVEYPVPTISKLPPTTRATFGFDDSKTQGAGELVVGGTIGIVPTPYVAVIVGKGPKIVNVA